MSHVAGKVGFWGLLDQEVYPAHLTVHELG